MIKKYFKQINPENKEEINEDGVEKSKTTKSKLEQAKASLKDAQKTITELHKIKNIKEILMLSGDKQLVVAKIAKQLGIDKAFGSLLPKEKLNEVEKLKNQGKIIAFIGDGINDVPVITIADVGLAMGGLGSDATIETADIIIQTDQPSKIATVIHIGNATNKIICQNITLALGIKILALILRTFGLTTMWEAVIADVGVALLAILNAVRIQHMKFLYIYQSGFFYSRLL